jgi:hypothetical protein
MTHDVPILGGFRRFYGFDAVAFLAACEGPPPAGFYKCCVGGWVGTGDLHIDYLVA